MYATCNYKEADTHLSAIVNGSEISAANANSNPYISIRYKGLASQGICCISLVLLRITLVLIRITLVLPRISLVPVELE